MCVGGRPIQLYQTEPRTHFSIRVDRRQQFSSMTSLGVYQDAVMLLQISQSVRLDLVFLLLGIVPRDSSAVVAPGLFDHALFAKKVGAFQCPFFIGGFEDEAVAKIEGEDARFLPTERRDERS